MFFSKLFRWFRVLYQVSPALTSNFLSKLNSLSNIWNHKNCKVISIMLDIKEAVAVTEFIVKKFQKINIYHRLEFPLTTPPKKRRKLVSSDSPRIEENKDISKSSDIFPKQISSSERHADDAKIKRNQKKIASLTSKMTKQKFVVMSTKDLRRCKRNFCNIRETNIPPKFDDGFCSALKSATKLSVFFKGCVNLVQTSKFYAIEDIDLVMKRVVRCGKVVSILDHWKTVGSSRRWNGAMITYKDPEDCKKVFKEMFLHQLPGVQTIYIPHHLMLIGRLENQYIRGNFGSSILIGGINPKAPRDKLNRELEQYGDIISSRWKTKDRSVCCEVTYPHVVEAIAAALALDGKCFARNMLTTRLKMRKREKQLHMMVCGHCF
ncbi:hypothetical protein CDAR_220491 [Caerostris darwini]|uniref:RRM domain-containing protein n=1 Tax=Caerostris darwini TaxID=1538125 RepID=A0AAV4UFH8_9ARAC|nr:hypothetical protein CDAR_220491 [Caerostris darwini]